MFRNFRFTSSGGRFDARRIPDVRDTVANIRWMSASRLLRRAEFRVKRLHVGSDHPGEELRDNARDAPEQKTVAETRELHNDRRLVFRSVDG